MAKPLGAVFVPVPWFSLCFYFFPLFADSSLTFVLRVECGPSKLLYLYALFPGTWRDKSSLYWYQFPKCSFIDMTSWLGSVNTWGPINWTLRGDVCGLTGLLWLGILTTIRGRQSSEKGEEVSNSWAEEFPKWVQLELGLNGEITEKSWLVYLLAMCPGESH